MSWLVLPNIPGVAMQYTISLLAWSVSVTSQSDYINQAWSQIRGIMVC